MTPAGAPSLDIMWNADSIFYVHANQTPCQKGHAIRALFYRRRHKKQRRTWSSSRVPAGHCLVNQNYVVVVLRMIITRLFLFRLTHTFTCTEILPSQYTHLSKSKFTGVGVVSNTYIRRGCLFVIDKRRTLMLQRRLGSWPIQRQVITQQLFWSPLYEILNVPLYMYSACRSIPKVDIATTSWY